MNKQSIVQQILAITGNAIAGGDQIHRRVSDAPFRLARVIHTQDLTFMLVDDAVNIYEQLLEQLLLQERWQEKYSAQYLDKAIQTIVATLLKEGRTPELAKRLFEQLKGEFDTFSEEYKVYIPVEGLNLLEDSFPMGKITFRKMTDALISDMFNQMKTIALCTTSATEIKEANIAWVKQRIDSLRGTICAECCIVADSQRAREKAEEETRRVLDVLRYAISMLFSRGLNTMIGLRGEVSSSTYIVPTISLDGQRYELHLTNKGPLQPLILSPENIQKMEEIGIFEVAAILKHSEHMTGFEKVLLRSIHWFASSQTQFEKENEFLNLMTCLETLLTPSGMALISPSLANQVAEGVARLLAAELEDRIALKKRVHTLYGMRSGTSHGGQKTIQETDLLDLRSIALALIAQMIQRKNEFPNHEALLRMLEEQRLRG